MYYVAFLNFFPNYTIVGGTSASEENKELNQLHSAERDSDITKTKSTLPSVFSVDSRNANGRTPLMNAAIYGNVEAVKSLIKRGADPSLVSNRGWNSLHFAAQCGDTDIIDLIYTRLPNIESKTGEGYTQLMIVALSGKLHGVKWFLEKGATVNSEDNRGWNTLHFAAQGGDADIISLILTHLPEIESKTAGGQTPLMIAVAFGKLPGVKYLLERGANPLAKDNDGQDSVYHALSRNPDFLDLLLSHVAKSKSTTSKSGW